MIYQKVEKCVEIECLLCGAISLKLTAVFIPILTRESMFRNRFIVLSFLFCPKLAFLTSLDSLIWCKRSIAASFWQVLVHFRDFCCVNFLTIGRQNGVFLKKKHDELIKFSSMRACDNFLSQFDFFEQTFLKVSITPPIMGKCLASVISQLTSQNVSRSSASPLLKLSFLLLPLTL